MYAVAVVNGLLGRARARAIKVWFCFPRRLNNDHAVAVVNGLLGRARARAIKVWFCFPRRLNNGAFCYKCLEGCNFSSD